MSNWPANPVATMNATNDGTVSSATTQFSLNIPNTQSVQSPDIDWIVNVSCQRSIPYGCAAIFTAQLFHLDGGVTPKLIDAKEYRVIRT